MGFQLRFMVSTRKNIKNRCNKEKWKKNIEGLWKIVAGDAVRELGLLYHRYKTYHIYEYHSKEVALNIVRIRAAGKKQQRIQAIGEGEMGQHITECAVSTRQRWQLMIYYVKRNVVAVIIIIAVNGKLCIRWTGTTPTSHRRRQLFSHILPHNAQLTCANILAMSSHSLWPSRHNHSIFLYGLPLVLSK